MKLLALAIRNVRRQTRRSVLTAGAVAVGVAAIVCLTGLSEGFVRLMTSEVVEGRTGALQIHRAGALERLDALPISLAFAADDALLQRVRAVAGVRAVSRRIRFDGSISNQRLELPFVGRAVDVAAEQLVCPRLGIDVTPGRALRADDAEAITVGAELGQRLGIESVTLSGQSAGGRANALPVRIVGQSSLRLPFENKRTLVAPLGLAQTLLGLNADEVTELAVAATPEADLAQVQQALAATLGAEYEVHTWLQLETYVRDTIRRQRAAIEALGAVLLLIVLLGIGSTVTMSVHERQTEIGTMLALGVRRGQIRSLFLLEALLLGAVGSVAGAVVGAAVVLVLGINGIALQVLETSVTLFPTLDVRATAVAMAAASVGAVLASTIQARRAARLDPVAALRE